MISCYRVTYIAFTGNLLSSAPRDIDKHFLRREISTIVPQEAASVVHS